MNDNLEQKLQSLRRQELPAKWKAQILGAATSSEAAAPAQSTKPQASLLQSLAPPRWLAWGMAAAWGLVFTLHWLTPADEPSPQANIAAEVSTRALQLRREMMQSLLVANLSNTP